MCFGQKVKTQQQQNKNKKIKTVAGDGNLTLAPKADALPLHH